MLEVGLLTQSLGAQLHTLHMDLSLSTDLGPLREASRGWSRLGLRSLSVQLIACNLVTFDLGDDDVSSAGEEGE